MATVAQKTCTACSETKSIEEFHRRKQNKDGRSGVCRECANSYGKQMYGRHRTTIRASQAEYARTHREDAQRRQREWKKRNPERYLALFAHYRHVRRARLKDQNCGCVTPEHLAHIRTLPCAYCPNRPSDHIDHVIPLGGGGPHCIANLQPACEDCNWSKNAKLLEHPPEPIFLCERTVPASI